MTHPRPRAHSRGSLVRRGRDEPTQRDSMSYRACSVWKEQDPMARKEQTQPHLKAVPMLLHESLYVGVDVGKQQHVAGFVSKTLLQRYERFEACPALAFAQSREGFRTLIDRIGELV